MCICVYVYLCICAYVYMCICVYVYMYSPTYILMFVYVSIQMSVCVSLSLMSVCVSLSLSGSLSPGPPPPSSNTACGRSDADQTDCAQNVWRILAHSPGVYQLGNTMHHTATHYNTLQHTATHCNTMHHTATHYNTLLHTATCCNTLQHTAPHLKDSGALTRSLSQRDPLLRKRDISANSPILHQKSPISSFLRKRALFLAQFSLHFSAKEP